MLSPREEASKTAWKTAQGLWWLQHRDRKREPCSTRACTFIVWNDTIRASSTELADERICHISCNSWWEWSLGALLGMILPSRLVGSEATQAGSPLRLHPGSVLSAFYTLACGFLPTSTINIAIYGWSNLHKIHRLTKFPGGIVRTLWLGGSAFKCTALRSHEAVGISSTSLCLHFLSHLIKVVTVQ